MTRNSGGVAIAVPGATSDVDFAARPARGGPNPQNPVLSLTPPRAGVVHFSMFQTVYFSMFVDTLWPNPVQRGAPLGIRSSNATTVEVEIRDLAGRTLWRARLGTSGPADGGHWVWTGRDRLGRMLPPGVYFVVGRTRTATTCRKIVLLQ
jgi:hypothetical protein